MLRSPMHPPAASPLTTKNASSWVTWNLLASLLIVLVPSQVRLGTPFWGLSADLQFFLAAAALTHLLIIAVLSRWALARGRIPFLAVVLVFTIAYGCFFAVFRVAGWDASGSMLAVAWALSVILASLSLGAMQALTPGLLLAAGSIVLFGLFTWPPESDAVLTTFHPVRLVVHEGMIPSEVGGGGLEAFGDDWLVVAGDGGLHHLETGASGVFEARRLSARVPVNLDAFRADMPQATSFKALDIMMLDMPDAEGRIRLLASHHHWNSEDRCFVVRLSLLEASVPAFLGEGADMRWETVYETSPCLPVAPGINMGVSGGSLLRMDESSVLLTVGDHSFDGVNQPETLAQDTEAHYGKTILIDLTTGAWEFYTTGHRNPQGLHRTPDGRIWSTEHGPKGGDELNLVEQNANYGWPLVSYGSNYGGYTWPLNGKQGDHAGYAEPVFSWLPSIGISRVVSVQRDLFPTWQGDLLIASLRAETIFRLRVNDRGVAFVEPIPIGARVRDLIEAADGRIVFLLDGGAVGWIEPL